MQLDTTAPNVRQDAHSSNHNNRALKRLRINDQALATATYVLTKVTVNSGIRARVIVLIISADITHELKVGSWCDVTAFSAHENVERPLIWGGAKHCRTFLAEPVSVPVMSVLVCCIAIVHACCCSSGLRT